MKVLDGCSLNVWSGLRGCIPPPHRNGRGTDFLKELLLFKGRVGHPCAEAVPGLVRPSLRVMGLGQRWARPAETRRRGLARSHASSRAEATPSGRMTVGFWPPPGGHTASGMSQEPLSQSGPLVSAESRPPAETGLTAGLALGRGLPGPGASQPPSKLLCNPRGL